MNIEQKKLNQLAVSITNESLVRAEHFRESYLLSFRTSENEIVLTMPEEEFEYFLAKCKKEHSRVLGKKAHEKSQAKEEPALLNEEPQPVEVKKERSPHPLNLPPLTEEQKRKILEYHAMGVSNKAISTHLGIHPWKVLGYISGYKRSQFCKQRREAAAVVATGGTP